MAHILTRLSRDFENINKNIFSKSLNEYFNLNKNIKCELKDFYDFTDDEHLCKQDFIITYGDVLHLELCITYPRTYPFKAPRWCLKNHIIKEDIHSIYLLDYYMYLISIHNDQYENDWSPIVNMEQDILYFITRVIHFEQLFSTPFEKNNKIRKFFKDNIMEELIAYVWHPTRNSFWKNYDTDLIDI